MSRHATRDGVPGKKEYELIWGDAIDGSGRVPRIGEAPEKGGSDHGRGGVVDGGDERITKHVKGGGFLGEGTTAQSRPEIGEA